MAVIGRIDIVRAVKPVGIQDCQCRSLGFVLAHITAFGFGDITVDDGHSAFGQMGNLFEFPVTKAGLVIQCDRCDDGKQHK